MVSDFASSRAFGDQTDGDQHAPEEEGGYGAVVTVQPSGKRWELAGRDVLPVGALAGATGVAVEVERVLGKPGVLVGGGASGGNTIGAPDFLTGVAAAVLQHCELAGVPCVVTAHSARAPPGRMYI